MPENTDKPTCPDCGGTIHRTGKCLLCEMFAASAAPGGDAPAGWPMLSDGMGVHPKQIPAAIAEDKRRGVKVEYSEDGRAKYDNQAHRNQHLKAFGKHDNNGGYRG